MRHSRRFTVTALVLVAFLLGCNTSEHSRVSEQKTVHPLQCDTFCQVLSWLSRPLDYRSVFKQSQPTTDFLRSDLAYRLARDSLISNNGAFTIYRIQRELEGFSALYRVNADRPEVAILITPSTKPAYRWITDYKLVADASYLIYATRVGQSDNRQLHLIDLNRPKKALRIGPAFPKDIPLFRLQFFISPQDFSIDYAMVSKPPKPYHRFYAEYRAGKSNSRIELKYFPTQSAPPS